MKYLLSLALLAVSAALRCQKRTQSNQSQFPSPYEFLPRLQQSIQSTNALQDPCKAQVILKEFYFEAGLGAKVNSLAASIIIALSGHGIPGNTPQTVAFCGLPGTDLSAERPSQSFYPEMWLQNFANGLGIPVCHACNTSMAAIRSQLMSDLVQLAGVHHLWPASVHGWRHEVMTKFFVLQENTSRQIDRALAGTDLGVDYIGVHIRHGDKGEESPLLAASKYADKALPLLRFASFSSDSKLQTITQKIKNVVRRHGIKTVFLASDDSTTLQKLQSALPTVTVKMAPRLEEWKYQWTAANGQYKEASLALLTDIVGLWRSKVFIGTGSSSLGRLIWALRGEEQRQHDISCDIPFGSEATPIGMSS